MILELGFDLGKRVELWGFEPQTSCYAMQTQHATNLILGRRTGPLRLRHGDMAVRSRRTGSGADQVGYARRTPGRAGTTGDDPRTPHDDIFCRSRTPAAALEGPIPRTNRGLTIKKPGRRLAIGPLTCTSW